MSEAVLRAHLATVMRATSAEVERFGHATAAGFFGDAHDLVPIAYHALDEKSRDVDVVDGALYAMQMLATRHAIVGIRCAMCERVRRAWWVEAPRDGLFVMLQSCAGLVYAHLSFSRDNTAHEQRGVWARDPVFVARDALMRDGRGWAYAPRAGET